MASYIYTHMDSIDHVNEKSEMLNYAKSLNLVSPQVVNDQSSIKLHWSERAIGQLLKTISKDDHIIVYEAANLACSTSQILEILSSIAIRRAQVHFVKYKLHVENNTALIDTQHILLLISKIESDFISKRTSQALARRKAAGLPLGRPKGRGNKSLKLDKFKPDIQKYLDLGISKASIAKLVDCHPQTLYDWLDRNNIKTAEDLEDTTA